MLQNRHYIEASIAGAAYNISLSFNVRGFINRLSDLYRFASEHNLDGFVIEDTFFLNSDRHHENVK